MAARNARRARLFREAEDAYVKGRYSKHYEISREQIDWLVERVEMPGQAVMVVCNEYLAKLAAETKALN